MCWVWTFAMSPTPRRVRVAWIVALLADAVQVVLVPFTASLSTWTDKPLDDEPIAWPLAD